MTDTLTAPTPAAEPAPRPPLWRDERVLRVAAQVAAIIAVGFAIEWLFSNLTDNLTEQNIGRDFGFLDRPAEFAVRDSSFDPANSIRSLIWVGVRNTAAVAGVGIVIAMVLGTLVGIGRLSTNWIVRKLATLYVETLRNIPVLVIIIFTGQALFTNGPLPLFNPTNPPAEIGLPGTDGNLAIISKTRLGFLSFANDDNTGAFWLIMLASLIAAVFVWRWRTKVNEATGAPHRRVLFSLGTILGVGVVAFVALGGPLRFSYPTVSESGRVIEGGIATNDGYVALTLALALYTASHIAEIVRGSILAIHKGQSEASNALALSGFQRYRFVVLPQALRIALPPIINQFLNLTKNSSLAIAVAYPDITALVKTAIGNGNPAPQMIMILMGVYLSFSLGISLILNVVNRRMQLVGR